jgi:Type I phosphodiesterase / nucleotide pyrophosphatase
MPTRWAYWKRVLAGAIFGLYMAHLLYFLNPQIDMTPGRLVSLTLVYGTICGFLFGSALWLLRVLRVRLFGRALKATGEPRMHGFGFVVLAGFVSLLVYWIHLHVLRIYLPIGAVRILSKATNVMAATAFALFILWLFERNAGPGSSRVITAAGCLLVVASSFFLYERRDSYRADRQRVVVANVGLVAGQRPMIVVAIRNLPYDWIVTLLGEGSLPFFESSRRDGFFTRLEPFPANSPKAIWASLATGKLPNRHGVTGRFSYRTALNRAPGDQFLLIPGGVGFRAWGLIPPVQRISAPLPAGDAMPLWTMFERLSFRTAVVNWPSAGKPGASFVATDRFFNRERIAGEVTPASETVAALALDKPIDASLAARFNGTRAAAHRTALEELRQDLWAGAVGIRAATSGPYELTLLALDGLGETENSLRLNDNALPEKTTAEGEAVRAYVEQLDRFLATLVRDFPDRTVVVLSPSGPAPPTIPVTPWAWAKQAIDPDDPGADDGFVVIRGQGIAHRENPPAAVATDIVPTVLFAAGLPLGRDMDGRVLTEAFTESVLRSTGLSMIQSYEAEKIVVRRAGG